MKKFNVLTESEMRNCLGGLMDRESFLSKCLNDAGNSHSSDPNEQYIIEQLLTDQCYDAYAGMSF